MQTCKVLEGMISVPEGTILKLSEDQVRRRVHAVKKLSGDKYEAKQPVNFKTGETFESEGDLSMLFKMGRLEIDGRSHDPKNQGKPVAVKEPKGGESGGESGGGDNYEEMTVPQIKAELDKRGVEYDKKSVKDKLLSLLKGD